MGAVAGQPPDWQQREHALDTSRSWIVEAPAGSGKTGLLIQRYLKLLSTVDQPEEVLAITFTRKATAEMRERVLHAMAASNEVGDEGAFHTLTRTLAAAVAERDRALGWELTRQPHRLNIRTIDAFASDLSNAAPLLEGSLGRLAPVDDASELYSRAARAVLLRLGGNDAELTSALQVLLRLRDADIADCEDLIVRMLGPREQWIDLLPWRDGKLDRAALDDELLPTLNRTLTLLVEDSLADLHRSFPNHVLEEMTAIARLVAEDSPQGVSFLRTHGAPHPTVEDLPLWQAIAKVAIKPGGEWYKQPRIAKHLKPRLEAAIDCVSHDDDLCRLLHAVRSLPPASYSQDEWETLRSLLIITAEAVAELHRIFAQEGVCDFAQVSTAARLVLRTRGTAGATRLRHLLVDEMQDTSVSQYGLLEAVTRDWDGSTQTVFLVGDPKQSIYLFRQARVERFMAALASGRFGAVPLHRLTLTANFRSSAQLVQSFNAEFAAIFAKNDGVPEAISYTPAAAVLPALEGSGWHWHARVGPYESDVKQRARTRFGSNIADANDLVDVIRVWRARPLPEGRTRPWSVAVLTRAREHMSAVLQQLREAGIPYRGVDMQSLAERQEVLDAVALTRALLHPADRAAWLSVLRAPWCGLSLADLHRAAAGDQPALARKALLPQLRERASMLSADGQAALLRTMQVLDTALGQRGRRRLAHWVEDTWFALGGDLCTNAAGRANVRSYFTVLERLPAPVEAQTIGAALKRLYAEPAHEPGAVDVMTMHKAKGLEWDLVLLPNLQRITRGGFRALVQWEELSFSGDSARRFLLAPVNARDSSEGAGRIGKYINDSRDARESAEQRRLFYVAATRAAGALHLFARPELDSKNELKILPDALLKAASPGSAGGLFEQQAQRLREQLAAGGAGQPLPEEEALVPDFAVEYPDGFKEAPLTLAAAAETSSRRRPHPRIERLPLSVDSAAQLAARAPAWITAQRTLELRQSFTRPEGSLAARALGNAVHAFAERIAREVAAGSADLAERFEEVRSHLPAWQAAVQTYLRGCGLSPADVRRLQPRAVEALSGMLASPTGRWLLSPHPGAASERAMLAESSVGTILRRLRLDRTFFAGDQPLSAVETTAGAVLWIVDLKTGEPGTRDTNRLMQRQQYEPQLRSYAAALAPTLAAGTPIMLALYYPFTDDLQYWRYEA